MTELEIKAAVRARDGHRCVECGKTSQEHFDETGRSLDVHRLFPGADYDVSICVTLCRACHGKKPRTMDELWFRHRPETSGVFMVAWNVALPPERAIYVALKEIADARRIHVETLVGEIVEKYVKELPHAYCI